VTSTVSPERYFAIEDGSDLPGEVEVAGDQLVQPGQRLDGDVGGLRDLDHLLACLA
jgi:hypothetical protein